MARDPEITPDLLLAHAGFVRSLARQLLSDEALVEDVVQETWVRALQEGPRRKEALAAWLRSVTRNLAFKAMRTSRRRIRREHVAARGEGLPSTSELVEREHSLKTVVGSVLSLPEHYRQVVMLRYFDDMPPRKIAVQLDLPVNTVRMRLHRALKLLRGTLDKEYGDRATSNKGLALLAFGVSRNAPIAVSTGSGITAAALLLAGTLAGGAALWWIFGDGSATPETTARPEGVGSALGGTDDAIALRDERSPERTALAPLDGFPLDDVPTSTPVGGEAGRVNVLVVDPAGDPVPGATVYGDWDEKGMLPRGRTGADGRLSQEVPLARMAEALRGGDALLFGTRAAGFAPAAIVDWNGDPEREVVIIARAGGVTLSGRVLDPSGNPVPGATITVGDSFRFGLGFLGAMVLTGDAGPGRLLPSQLMDEDRRASFKSWRHARGYLGPQVLTPEGSMGRLMPQLAVTTDGEGRWHAPGLEPGTQTVRVDANGFQVWRSTVDMADGAEERLDIELALGAQLRGEARREDGLPIERGLVYAVGETNGVRRSVRIEPDGNFVLTDLPAGRIRLFAESRTRRKVTHSAETVVDVVVGQASSWDAILTAQAVLLGKLVDAEGRPLIDWRVQIRLDQNPSRPVAEATTDVEGEFGFVARPPFPASLYIYHPGERQVQPTRVVAELPDGTDRMLIQLTGDEARGCVFTGQVRDRDGTFLPDNSSVLLIPAGTHHINDLKTDAMGRFGSPALPGGKYWFAVPFYGLTWVAEEPIELSPGIPFDLGEVRLPDLGRLSFAAAKGDSTSAPVRLTRVCGGGLRLVVFEGRASLPTEIPIAPGRYEVELIGKDVAPATQTTVRSNETSRVVLR